MEKRAYDLLFIYDDNKSRRLPFSYSQFLNPIGIFPFSSSDYYLEFEEKEIDKDVGDDLLPDETTIRLLFGKKDQLNDYLAFLEKPLLQGIYLLKGGRVADFDKNEIKERKETVVKCRYLKIFTGSQKEGLF